MSRSRVVHPNLDLGCKDLFFDLQVRNALNVGQSGSQCIRLAPQHIQVFAKNLDGDLRSNSRKHVINPVRDRLPHFNRCRQVGQTRADVRPDFVHRAGQLSGGLDAHVQLADMDAFGVLIQLSAPTASTHMNNFRHLLDQNFGLASQG